MIYQYIIFNSIFSLLENMYINKSFNDSGMMWCVTELKIPAKYF